MMKGNGYCLKSEYYPKEFLGEGKPIIETTEFIVID